MQTNKRRPIKHRAIFIRDKHPAITEMRALERRLAALPDGPQGELVREAARLRLAQHWHDKTLAYGFRNLAIRHGANIDSLLDQILPER